MNNLQKLLFAFLISPLLSIKGEIDIQPEQHMSQRGSARSHSDDVVFRHIGEHQLVEGKELKTIEMLGKEWSVSLEFKRSLATYTNIPKQASIIQLSTSPGHDDLQTKTTANGNFISIMTEADQYMIFSSALTDSNGEEIDWIKGKGKVNLTEVDKWTRITISQKRVQKVMDNCVKYRQRITIDGEKIFQRRNTVPQALKNVRVYASSNKFPAQPGSIKNFVIRNGFTGDFFLQLLQK